LLSKSQELNLIHLAVYHVLNTKSEVQSDVLLAAAEGFSALANNEDFSTNWQRFFVDASGQVNMQYKDNFMMLEGAVVGEALKDHPDKKKDLRPLLDFFNKIRRTYG